MSFKKLALVTAMFAATSGAYAMEAMDEEALAATTGQDGITVTISAANNLTLNQIIHDKDGVAATTNQGGAIVIGDVGTSVTPNGGMVVDFSGADNLYGTADDVGVSLIIDADGGDAAGSAPYLNVGVSLSAGLKIATGDIRVASSAASAAGGGIGSITQASTFSDPILNSMDITLGATTLNVQLGNEPQGSMINIVSTITNGVTIDNFALNDASSGESIGITQMVLRDATGSNLTIGDIDVDVEAAGLVVAINSLGTGGVYQSLAGVTLGSTPSIGDIEIIGLNLNGMTLTIAGH